MHARSACHSSSADPISARAPRSPAGCPQLRPFLAFAGLRQPTVAFLPHPTRAAAAGQGSVRSVRRGRASAPQRTRSLQLVVRGAAMDAHQAAELSDSEIRKSANDGREYRRFTLPNQMSVLLISDPEIQAMLAAQKDQQEGGGGELDMAEDGVEDDDGSEEEEEEEAVGDGSEEDEEEEDGAEEEGEENGTEGSSKGSKAGHIKKAAAAMAVGVGSFQDPEHLMGLSHYLEHMLFMGSAKYPNENDYDDFLSAHGGSNNAYTELEYTNFHFDVTPAHLEGALDRFAQFFLSPLCLQGSMEREVMAVESEFKGVLQSDSCRALQLSCTTAKPNHVYRKFSWGNRKSLWDDPHAAGIDVREELLKYYKAHYSAERMNLVLLGGEPLDVLQGWVEEKFAAVPSGLGPRPSVVHEGYPFEGVHMYVIPAVKESHSVDITFQLPSLDSEYRKKGEDYISHLVGHEGRGSLLSALKAKGWASDVCAGVDSSGYEHNQIVYLLTVSVTLTEAGLEAGPGAGLAVVEVVFQYLRMLREAGPQEWIFNELKAISEMRFMFQEEEDACEYCMRLAPNLHRYPPKDTLSADTLFVDYDPELIKKLLDLLHPTSDGLRIDLLTTHFDSMRKVAEQIAPGKAAEGHEPWFDFSYIGLELPEALLLQWAQSPPTPDMHLPIRNPYVPEDFTVRGSALLSSDETGLGGGGGGGDPMRKLPSLLVDRPGLRLWHKLDTTFCVPKANAYFILSSPAIYSSPEASVKTYLAVKLLDEAMNEDAYLAETADLSYSSHLDGLSGITLQVYGFSQKLPVLTKQIFRTLANLKVEPEAFARVKEVYTRNLRNAHIKPGRAASFSRLYALRRNMWHTDAQLSALEHIQPQHVQDAVPVILESLHIEALLHGNFNSEEALALGTEVRELVEGSPLPEQDRPIDRVVILGTGSSYVYRMPVKNADETNSALENYYQVAEYTTRGGALVSMVDQLISEKCYDTLRTKEQLGYTVHCGQRLTHGILGFCVVVVSTTHAAADLDVRVEAFLEAFQKTLQDMGEEEFTRNRSALISNKLMKHTNLGEEADMLWDKVVNKWYAFDARQREAAELENVTLADVQEWYSMYMAPTSSVRNKVSIQVVGQGHSNEPDKEAATVVESPVPPTIVESLDDLKAQLPLFPAFRRAPPAASKAAP